MKLLCILDGTCHLRSICTTGHVQRWQTCAEHIALYSTLVVDILWSMDQIWASNLFGKKFYWITTTLFCLYIVCGCFHEQKQRWVVATETMWHKCSKYSICRLKTKTCWLVAITAKSVLFFIMFLCVHFEVISQGAVDLYLILQLQNIR